MLIKQILKSDTGKELVYLNLSFPEFSLPVLQSANEFYNSFADNFIFFVNRKILPKAEAASAEANFKPFSAVIKHTLTEREDYFSVEIRSFVFDGASRAAGKTLKHNWNKKNGFISKK